MSPNQYFAAAATGQPPFYPPPTPPPHPTPYRQITPECFREVMGADADVDVDAEEDEADAADAPAAAELVFSPAPQHRTIIQLDNPHKQEACRRACRPL